MVQKYTNDNTDSSKNGNKYKKQKSNKIIKWQKLITGLRSIHEILVVMTTAVKPLEYQVEYRALEQSLNITM